MASAPKRSVPAAAALVAAALLLSGCDDSEPERLTEPSASEELQAGQPDSGSPSADVDIIAAPEAAPGGVEEVVEEDLGYVPDDQVNAGHVETTFIDGDGEPVGMITVRGGDALTISGMVTGLPPGQHALHVHEVGSCEPPDFSSAGDHYNPFDAEHGAPDADRSERHAGDLPNQTVGEDGDLRLDVTSNLLTLSGGDAPLLDDDGSALILHADSDDYQSQPDGGSGEPIACAVIDRSELVISAPQ